MKIKILILFISYFFSVQAQKEFWGINKTESYENFSDPLNPVWLPYYGNISKYDSNGQNATVVYTFDGVNGKLPGGKLFQASNGKLYGLTSIYTVSTATENNACLFEYDLILSKYKVLYSFDYTLTSFYYTQYMSSGVIEGLPNKLFGSFRNRLFCYDLITGIVTNGFLHDNIDADLTGEFVKGSDGFLYGTMYNTNICPTNIATGANFGMIIMVNPITLTSERKYSFNCGTTDGSRPEGSLIQAGSSNFYGTARGGGDLLYNSGTLYEFNTATNTFTKKVDFDGNNLGAFPSPLVDAGNGIFYGVCENGGTNIYTYPNNGVIYTNHWGTLFEYNVANNTITKLHDFGNQNFPTDSFTGKYPKSIMKTTTGLYFGISDGGMFKFNPADNSVVLATPDCIGCPIGDPFAGASESIIEICRKPSYQEFLPNTYNPVAGSVFTYNIQNANATTYVWKKGITVLPLQTTGILNLPSITTSDIGVYTCTMTNECGVTVTMPLNINVTNLATETIDNYKELISLYPNPTKGNITLKFPENRGMKAISYKVTNLLGQVVLQNDIAKNNTATTITIDTAGFANGIYQVTLATDKGNWNGKFVKE